MAGSGRQGTPADEPANCDLHDVAAFAPLCQQLGYGPDIDYGVCVDPDGECRVWKYDRYGTAGGYRCYA